MKLNIKQDGKTHSIEEKITLVNGKYSNHLKHDNVIRNTILVNSASGLQGENITTFTTTKSQDKPWETIINVFNNKYDTLYISYQSSGDTVDADDYNYLNTNKANINHNHLANEVKFEDGDSFQDKLDKGTLKGQKGDKGDEGPKGDQGPAGKDGSDATVTKDKIISELGYTPEDEIHAKSEVERLEKTIKDIVTGEAEDRVRVIPYITDTPVMNELYYKAIEKSPPVSHWYPDDWGIWTVISQEHLRCKASSTYDSLTTRISGNRGTINIKIVKEDKNSRHMLRLRRAGEAIIDIAETRGDKEYNIKVKPGDSLTITSLFAGDVYLKYQGEEGDYKLYAYKNGVEERIANAYLVEKELEKYVTKVEADSKIEILNENLEEHTSDTKNPHKVAKADVGLDKVDNTSDADKPISNATKTYVDDGLNKKQDTLGFTPENIALKGKSNGYTPLDANGRVPLQYIPDIAKQQTYVVENKADMDKLTGLIMGEKCYVTSLGDSYIWNGKEWQVLSKADWENVNLDWENIVNRPESNQSQIDSAVSDSHKHANKSVLDEITDTVLSNVQKAFDHISDAVKHITSDERKLWNTVSNKAEKVDLDNHKSNKDNPHSVTKAQVGLGNVDNTADLNKPVSNATKTELGNKVSTKGDTMTGKLVVDGGIFETELTGQNINIVNKMLGGGGWARTLLTLKNEEESLMSIGGKGSGQDLQYMFIGNKWDDNLIRFYKDGQISMYGENVLINNRNILGEIDKKADTTYVDDKLKDIDNQIEDIEVVNKSQTERIDNLSEIVVESGNSMTQSIQELRDKKADQSSLDTHTNNKSNPHNITKSQIGLSNVDNTSDLNKPISTATQNALNKKADSTDIGNVLDLETNSKVVVEAINEVKNSIPADADLGPINKKIDELDKNTLKKGGITCSELRGF